MCPRIFTCEVARPRLDAHTPARGSPHTRPVHVNMSNEFAWYCMHISMHVCFRELSQCSRLHTHLDVHVRTGSCFIANEGVNACIVARACPCACVCTLAPGARPRLCPTVENACPLAGILLFPTCKCHGVWQVSLETRCVGARMSIDPPQQA